MRFETLRRVEFCETDAAGIAHFSNFMIYMEQAEHALLRELGFSVVEPRSDGWHLSWPRVHVECDFEGAVRFEDQLTIQVGVERLGTKSVSYVFSFQKDGQQIAKGKTTAVCCRVKHGCPLESTAIPQPLSQKLEKYLISAKENSE